MQNVKKHLELLGLKVKDKVTGFKGVVDTMSFDLFGCIQAGVNPGLDKKGDQKDCRWFDVSRLTVTSTSPVMDVPNFTFGLVADGLKGPADKAPPHS